MKQSETDLCMLISPRILQKMSIFSVHVQIPFYWRPLMILKMDTRLGFQIKFLSTEGGTINSCTATDSIRNQYDKNLKNVSQHQTNWCSISCVLFNWSYAWFNSPAPPSVERSLTLDPSLVTIFKSLAVTERRDFGHGVKKCSFSGKCAGIFGKGISCSFISHFIIWSPKIIFGVCKSSREFPLLAIWWDLKTYIVFLLISLLPDVRVLGLVCHIREIKSYEVNLRTLCWQCHWWG